MSHPVSPPDTAANTHSQSLSPAKPASRSRRWLGLGAVGLLFAICTPIVQAQLTASESATEVAAARPLSVETLTVEAAASYTVSRSYTGEIAALRSSDLGFTRGGELVQVLVAEGDRVTAGQSLAQLDTASLQTQKRQLEAQLAAAQAQLLELERGARQEDIAAAEAEVRDFENQLQLQQQQRSRREFLYAEGAISREQLDEFAFGAETLEARRDRAQSNLNELRNGTRPEQIAAQQAVVDQLVASIADLDVDLNKSTLIAPFDGIVAAQSVDEGVVVGAGQSVVRLVENQAPEARIGLPETAAQRLTAGTPVTVTLGDTSYNATVKSLLPEIDPDTRTQLVVFQLEPTALTAVNLGQTARVGITETIPTEGMWLPAQALIQDIRGLWSVYVVMPADSETEPDIVQPKSVEILHEESRKDTTQEGLRVFVRGTVQPGDRIVADGVHRLIPGQPVTTVE
ncbi:MAG: efflux RND transporter periplasmic adaptor subunit [Leptolyngbya sp. SIOISBB]|nr:efflux RND transporter periplasmic adaptor subunit [Leptolyngbya sp. SIOISBB]